MAPTRRALFALFAYAASVSCQVLDYRGTTSYGGPGTGMYNETFLRASRTPNATSAVDFSLRSQRHARDIAMTWRVNVTSVLLPNSADESVALTSFDLNWSGGNDSLDAEIAPLQDAINQSQTNPFCASIITAAFPTNVTNRYNSSAAGDCSYTLGTTCVQSILGSLGGQTSNACKNPGPLSSLDGCESSFGVSRDYAAGVRDLAHLTNTLNRTDGFYYYNSGTTAPSNETYYKEAVNLLQMLVLSGDSEPVLLCQRVNNTTTSTSTGSLSHVNIAGAILLSLLAISCNL